MKYFIILIFLFFHAFVQAETLYYKNINTSEEDSTLMRVEFPEDCLEIIEINNDQSLEFKNNDGIEKIITECNTFLKGKKIKNTFKSGSDKILDTGVKVKEGIQQGLKSGTTSITDSISTETKLIVEDTVKLKDGIVGGTGKIISGTLETGSKITSGVSSFFKGIFSSEN
tara:strand:+ start:50 stop:559 length:510 start_codon:yes stop_codon:yes gene_type:complete